MEAFEKEFEEARRREKEVAVLIEVVEGDNDDVCVEVFCEVEEKVK